MSRPKGRRYTRTLTIPVDEELYEYIKEQAEKHLRSHADMTRLILRRQMELDKEQEGK